MSAVKSPRVWLPLDRRMLGSTYPSPYLVLGEKYANAVRVGAHARPVTYPMAGASDIEDIIDEVDGVLLTGSPANVHPSHFGESVTDPSLPLDPHRDDLTLTLVHICVERGIPLFGICRGYQEINVALGGSLHQQVHHTAGMMNHREPDGDLDVQYALAHRVEFIQDSIFAKWAGGQSTQVNSLHGQGVNRLAPGLKAHGFAPDGLIEAFEVENASTFAFAVQWHPEWKCWENPFYAHIFAAFGSACVQRAEKRSVP